jgi:ABC-type uncharacterized transport system ATPase subunit
MFALRSSANIPNSGPFTKTKAGFMEDTFLFEMNHVTKRFPGVVALKNVTLHVRAGTIHGLVGENGACS